MGYARGRRTTAARRRPSLGAAHPARTVGPGAAPARAAGQSWPGGPGAGPSPWAGPTSGQPAGVVAAAGTGKAAMARSAAVVRPRTCSAARAAYPAATGHHDRRDDRRGRARARRTRRRRLPAAQTGRHRGGRSDDPDPDTHPQLHRAHGLDAGRRTADQPVRADLRRRGQRPRVRVRRPVLRPRDRRERRAAGNGLAHVLARARTGPGAGLLHAAGRLTPGRQREQRADHRRRWHSGQPRGGHGTHGHGRRMPGDRGHRSRARRADLRAGRAARDGIARGERGRRGWPGGRSPSPSRATLDAIVASARPTTI